MRDRCCRYRRQARRLPWNRLLSGRPRYSALPRKVWLVSNLIFCIVFRPHNHSLLCLPPESIFQQQPFDRTVGRSSSPSPGAPRVGDDKPLIPHSRRSLWSTVASSPRSSFISLRRRRNRRPIGGGERDEEAAAEDWKVRRLPPISIRTVRRVSGDWESSMGLSRFLLDYFTPPNSMVLRSNGRLEGRGGTERGGGTEFTDHRIIDR